MPLWVSVVGDKECQHSMMETRDVARRLSEGWQYSGNHHSGLTAPPLSFYSIVHYCHVLHWSHEIIKQVK